MTSSITIYEAMRSVLYVPFYLATARNDWDWAGLTVKINTPPKPAEALTALATGHADICLGASTRVLVKLDADPTSTLISFAQLVGRDPFLLVGREPNPKFSFHDLVGRRIAVAREAPTPWLTLRNDLVCSGIDPETIVHAVNATMPENAGRLSAGEVDVIQVFQPYAEQALASDAGHVWHCFASRGPLCFTTLFTTRNFLAHRGADCRALVQALARAQRALHSEAPADIAAQVSRFLPAIDRALLERVISGYVESGVWPRTPELSEEAFEGLRRPLATGGLIKHDIAFSRFADVETSRAWLED